MRRAVLLLSVLVACGGGDSNIGPGSSIARIDVTGPSNVVGVGEDVNLTATTRDAQGNAISGAAVTWRTSNASVATVSSAGVVHGVAVGTATISANIGTVSGRIDIAVVDASAQSNCDDTAGLGLAVGEVHSLTAAERATLCVGGGSGGGEFVLVAYNADSAAVHTNVTFLARNTTAAAGPPSPRISSSPAIIASPSSADWEFHLGLREMERRELAWRLRAPRSPSLRTQTFAPGGISPIVGVTGVPAVGSTIQLNANSRSACSSPQFHSARIAAVSNTSIVAVDVGAPAGGFTDAEYQSFAVTMDTLIYPLDTLYFDSPSDLDGNGRVVLFFTQAVNQLSVPGSPSFVGGFFFARDLFPTSGNSPLGTCAGSNEAEMLYLPVADPNSVINGNFKDKAGLLKGMAVTMAHELQHLIDQSRRVYINTAATDFQDIWLDEHEGLVAQELLYYRAAGLGPRQNLDLATVTATPQRTDAVNAYGVQNLAQLDAYIAVPQRNSVYAPNDSLETGGAGWEYLRYVLDRTGGPDVQYLRALSNTTRTGIDALQAVFGSVFPDITTSFEQWAVAQYVDDTGISTDPKYQFPSWNYRDLIVSGFRHTVYPLAVTSLGATSPVMVNLRGGGAAYLRFGVAGNATGQVQPGAGAGTPARVRLFLVRTK